MRAVRFDSYGDIDVLDVRQVDVPEPGPGQLRVQVRAAGINPGEAKIRDGSLAAQWPATFPEGEGSDLAGVVDAIGPGVDAFVTGDEVLGYTNERASHAEYVVVDADAVVPRPAGLPWPVAGALFVAGTSAYALNQAAGVGAGDVVVVSAAAGGVGSLTAQWARVLGATVIGLAGPDNHEFLRGLGVTPVDYHGDDLAGRVTAAAGRPVTVLLDTFGPPYVDLGLELGVTPERIASVADFAAGDRGATVVQHFTVATPAVLTELAEAMADGRVVMPVSATYALDDVRAAYFELERGHTRGKIVLLP